MAKKNACNVHLHAGNACVADKCVNKCGPSKLGLGDPTGPKIQARPGFLRSPDQERWAHAGLGGGDSVAKFIFSYEVGCWKNVTFQW